MQLVWRLLRIIFKSLVVFMATLVLLVMLLVFWCSDRDGFHLRGCLTDYFSGEEMRKVQFTLSKRSFTIVLPESMRLAKRREERFQDTAWVMRGRPGDKTFRRSRGGKALRISASGRRPVLKAPRILRLQSGATLVYETSSASEGSGGVEKFLKGWILFGKQELEIGCHHQRQWGAHIDFCIPLLQQLMPSAS